LKLDLDHYIGMPI